VIQILNSARGLLQADKNMEALELLNEIVQQEPGNIEIARMRGLAWYNLKEYQKAIDILQAVLIYDPEEVNLYIDLCACYFLLEDYQMGSIFARKGLEKDPENQYLLRGYALVLKNLGEVDEAVAVLLKVVTKNPNDTEGWQFLGNIYADALGEVMEAKKCFEKIVEIEPDNYQAWARLCYILFRDVSDSEAESLEQVYEIAKRISENSDDKIAVILQHVFVKFLDYEYHDRLGSFKEYLERFADSDALLPLILIMSRVKSMQDRWDLLEAYRKWGNRAIEDVGKSVVRKVRRKLSKKVRLGILSTDVSNNHVFHFVRPIIEHLDIKKFDLYTYSPLGRAGYCFEGLTKSKSKEYRRYLLHATDYEIAQDIADDGLDLLLETGIAFLKPKLLAYKAAPVQVSWLDCPYSSGLPADYIVVDPYINPGQDLLLEKPLILTNTWVAVDERRFSSHILSHLIPEDRNGYITFGTLNSTFKLNYEVFRTWAGIMNMVPGSRFLYVRPETVSPTLQANFCRYMEQYGISPEQISFVATRTQHLDQYNNIDIALDVFPHTGGTTTCEALWMGVPVVTLVGPSFFERLSYSNLSNSGLADLCAFSIKEYQNIVLKLVQDKEYRRYLKKNLRQQVLDNPLGQPQQFVKDFEKGILDVLGGG